MKKYGSYNYYKQNNTTSDGSNLVSAWSAEQWEIFRIHDCWNDCHKYATSGQLEKWFWELDQVWLCLIGRAQVKNKKYTQENIIHREEAYKLINDKTVNGRIKFYNAILKWTEFLKVVETDVGLTGRMRDIEDDLMD